MGKKRTSQGGNPIRDRVVALRRVRAGDLLANPRNWRTHPEAQKRALAGALAEIGYAGALLARETEAGLELIDGHLRAETTPDALVPVLVLDVDEVEALKLLAILDPLGAMATADAGKLQALLGEVKVDDQALREMLADLGAGAGVGQDVEPGGGGDDFDATPEEEGPTRTSLGELWEIGGKHRLLVGDCTEAENVARLMGGEKAALVVTSPPYNQSIDKFRPSGMHKEGDWVGKVERLAYADSMPEEEYQAVQRSFLEVWYDVMEDGSSLFYNHKHRYRSKRVLSPMEWLPGQFNWRQEVIWRRPGSVTQNARMFIPSDERVYWLYKGDDFYFNDTTEHKTWSSVWDVRLEANLEHAVAYPLELPSRPIRACSKVGALVGDPFLGSGTTLIAAHRLGRRCYGCEIEPRYADVVLKRAEAEGLTCARAN